MKGIRKICSESKNLNRHGEYLQINYNRKTGEAWSNYHYNLGQNSYTCYDDPDIINCGNITRPATMKEIAAMIENTRKERECYDSII